jgi:hypothetical protein
MKRWSDLRYFTRGLVGQPPFPLAAASTAERIGGWFMSSEAMLLPPFQKPVTGLAAD